MLEEIGIGSAPGDSTLTGPGCVTLHPAEIPVLDGPLPDHVCCMQAAAIYYAIVEAPNGDDTTERMSEQP